MAGCKAVFILLLALFALPTVHARDYSLEGVTMDLVVDGGGALHVTESIDYSFEGTFQEVYRRVYRPPWGDIRHIEIACSPIPCEGRVDRISRGYDLVGVLPQPTPKDITFTISYDYYRGVKVYDDATELHYKLWGEEWDKPLGNLRATIHLPSGLGDDARFWLHPPELTRSARREGDSIVVEAGRIPSNSLYEIRVVFPRLENPGPFAATINQGPGLEKILKVERDYQRKRDRLGVIYVFTWLLALVALAVPFYIYYKFGREPEVNYYAAYEREPPTNSKPVAVNAIMRGKLGTPDIDGFVATILDLVYRGYLGLEEEGGDIVITIKNPKTEDLLKFERRALNFLAAYSQDGKLRWKRFKEEVEKDNTFYRFITRWHKQIQRQIRVDSLFVSRGNRYLMASGGITP
jgi:uncharacterized membrane protein